MNRTALQSALDIATRLGLPDAEVTVESWIGSPDNARLIWFGGPDWTDLHASVLAALGQPKTAPLKAGGVEAVWHRDGVEVMGYPWPGVAAKAAGKVVTA